MDFSLRASGVEDGIPPPSLAARAEWQSGRGIPSESSTGCHTQKKKNHQRALTALRKLAEPAPISVDFKGPPSSTNNT